MLSFYLLSVVKGCSPVCSGPPLTSLSSDLFLLFFFVHVSCGKGPQTWGVVSASGHKWMNEWMSEWMNEAVNRWTTRRRQRRWTVKKWEQYQLRVSVSRKCAASAFVYGNWTGMRVRQRRGDGGGETEEGSNTAKTTEEREGEKNTSFNLVLMGVCQSSQFD